MASAQDVVDDLAGIVGRGKACHGADTCTFAALQALFEILNQVIGIDFGVEIFVPVPVSLSRQRRPPSVSLSAEKRQNRSLPYSR
jgi:hypothetical protein